MHMLVEQGDITTESSMVPNAAPYGHCRSGKLRSGWDLLRVLHRKDPVPDPCTKSLWRGWNNISGETGARRRYPEIKW